MNDDSMASTARDKSTGDTSPDAAPPVAVLAVLVVLLVFPSAARAGAWAQKDKGLYAKASIVRSSAGRQYKENGETFQLLSENEPGSFTLWGLLVYGEFGLLPKLTVTMSTQLSTAAVESDLIEVRTSGMGDVRTGLKFQFLDEPLVMSVMGTVTTPTGYTPDPSVTKAPTLGLGVPMYEGSLLIGKSFHPLPMYASAQTGFRYRGSRLSRGGDTVDYPPEIPYLAEVGVQPVDWLWVRGVVNGVHGLGDPDALDAFSLSPLTQSYTKVGPSLIFNLGEHYQINVDYLYTATGVNAVQSHDITVGFALDRTL